MKISIINILKIATLPKATYRFNAISITVPGTLFTDIKNKMLKRHVGTQKTK